MKRFLKIKKLIKRFLKISSIKNYKVMLGETTKIVEYKRIREIEIDGKMSDSLKAKF